MEDIANRIHDLCRTNWAGEELEDDFTFVLLDWTPPVASGTKDSEAA